ncbi:MAG: DMT family transporter [Phycisphaerales bacterium]
MASPGSGPPHEHPTAGLSTAAGTVTVLLTLLGWSVTPLFIRYFATFDLERGHPIDPWTSNGWRYGFSALLWGLPLVLWSMRGRLPAGIWKAALIPGLMNCLGQIGFTWAHYKIDPGLLTFGLRAQMIVVAVGAALLFPLERLVIRRPSFIVGILMVMGGTAGTIVFDDGFGATTTMFGVGLSLWAGAFFAGYALAVRKCMAGMNAMMAFAVISQYTAGTMLVIMLLIGDEAGATALELPAPQFGLLLLSSVIGIGLGHVLYYLSIARLGVAVSTGVIQLQPFTVALLSLVWFGEVLSVSQWVTGAVAVSGALVMLAVQHRVMSRARRGRGEAAGTRDELPADKVAAAAESESERHERTGVGTP